MPSRLLHAAPPTHRKAAGGALGTRQRRSHAAYGCPAEALARSTVKDLGFELTDRDPSAEPLGCYHRRCRRSLPGPRRIRRED